MTLSELRASWPKVVEAATRDSIFTGALLASGKPISVTDAEIDLRMDHGIARFHVERINAQVVEAALKEALGKRYMVRFVMDGAA